jgi:hypothetical protein
MILDPMEVVELPRLLLLPYSIVRVHGTWHIFFLVLTYQCGISIVEILIAYFSRLY